MESNARSRWSLSFTGNRVMLGVVLGLVVFVTTRSILGGVVVGGLAFVIATVFTRLRS
ncbi:hypothetical protein [Actinoplanes solisilvae]|uniref:hypothetical protein n=1 Tax=Actinoplanes solisilvae TaxID=2486853 RepID=UPI0013E3A7B2|nr:hypothetical protein [Actinoplanes solisilvae]